MDVSSEASRSWLLVNAAGQTPFESFVNGTDADEVILDLEDAVAPNDKNAARAKVTEYLNSGGRGWVRINDASSEYWSADCNALADASGLKGVVLAKAEGGNHMWDTANRLGGGVPVIALIETARGLARVHDIAAARPCFRIAFGVNDYTLDIGVENDPMALAYSRSQLVVASRAAHIPGPIDGPTRDQAQLADGVALTRRMGMTGKLALDSGQIAEINTGLSPAPTDIAWAHAFVETFNKNGGKPKNGSDLPRLHRAQTILHKADMLGIAIPAT